MKQIIGIFALLFVLQFIAAHAQQITLTGQVSLHNSGYRTGQIKYVKDAYATAPFAAPGSTDDRGEFRLEFVGMRSGQSTEVKVEKNGYEVVNKRELRDVVIGRKSPLRVYLAPKGQIAQAQTELYNINIKALTARYDLTISRLRQEDKVAQAAIEELETQFGQTIATRLQAEALLNEQLHSLRKRLPEVAKELASVNLDFATDMYRKAYEYFKAGEIEKTIEILDESILDAEAADVVDHIGLLDTSIANLETAWQNETERIAFNIESHRVKARSFMALMQYDQALQAFENTIALIRKHPEGRQQLLAQTYQEVTEALRAKGDKSKALEYETTCVQILEEFFGPGHQEILPAYLRACIAFHEARDWETAILYGHHAYDLLQLEVNESFAVTKDIAGRLTLCHEQMGYRYEELGEWYQAAQSLQEALKFSPERKDLDKKLRKLKRKL